MDDDSEDLAFYQAIMKHLRLFSSVFWSFPITYISKLFSGQNSVGTTKLEVSLSVFAIVTFVLILYQSVELLRRFFPSRVHRRSFNPVAQLARERDSWELERGTCGVYALRGRRPNMEDRFSVLTDPESGIALYGIFDGHGGEFAAEFVERRLFRELLKKLQAAVQGRKEEDPTEEFVRLLTAEILDLDTELLLKVKASRDVAGDSRGVICDSKGNTIPLSFDHKPDQLKERRRIRDAGGFIAYNGVWRVAGILATSRALGDFPLKERNLVIARPDILTFDLVEMRPRFMILATDGLWDALSNEEAVAHVVQGASRDALRGARSLALHAHKSGSMDNVTVLLVHFGGNL